MRVLIVGSAGLLGREIVKLLSSKHEIIEASRKKANLKADISDRASIVALYNMVGTVDSVICVARDDRFPPPGSSMDDDFSYSVANKLMGQANLVRYGVEHISKGGSVTLTGGTLAQRPEIGNAAASVNVEVRAFIRCAALNLFVRSAALELHGRLRVNAISPGWMTETWTLMGKDPAGGISAAEVAKAYERSLMEDMTGQVIVAGQ